MKKILYSTKLWNGSEYITDYDEIEENIRIKGWNVEKIQTFRLVRPDEILQLHLSGINKSEFVGNKTKFKKLEYLDLSQTDIDDRDFDENGVFDAALFPSLKTLCLDDTKIEKIDFVNKFQSLECLTLKKCNYISYENVKENLKFKFGLKFFHISDAEFANDLPKDLIESGLAIRFRIYWINEYIKSHSGTENIDKYYVLEINLWQQLINEYFLAYTDKNGESKDEKRILDLGKCGLSSNVEEITKINEYFKLTIDDIKQVIGFTSIEIIGIIPIKEMIFDLNLGIDYYINQEDRILSTNYLNDNTFSELPKLELPNLKTLQIRNSKIETINTEYYFNESLTELDLSNNLISSYDNINQFKNLIELSLHANKLTSFFENSNESNILPVLKILYLSSNSLKNFDFINAFEKLTHLYLYDNKITEIPNIRTEHIKTINLANNAITSIKGKVKENKNIEIDIRQNPIIDIPQPLLGTNKWQEISAFFEKEEEVSNDISISRNNYVKLFIVGHTEQVRENFAQLIYKKYNKEEHTEFKYLDESHIAKTHNEFGIVKDIYLKMFVLNDTSLKSNLFEHFLDPDSIVIVIWDEKYNDVRYWVESVYNLENFGSETQIFLLNLQDKNTKPSQIFRSEFDHFVNITFQNFIQISDKKDNNNNMGYNYINIEKDINFNYFESFLELSLIKKSSKRSLLDDEYYRVRNEIKKPEEINWKKYNDRILNLLHIASHIVIVGEKKYSDINVFIEDYKENLNKYTTETIPPLSDKTSDIVLPGSEEKEDFLKFFKILGQIVKSKNTDFSYVIKNLKATSQFDAILDMLSEYAFKSSFKYEISKYYSQKLFIYLIYKIQLDSNYNIKSIWKNGLLLSCNQGSSDTSQFTVLIKFRDVKKEGYSEIFISVEDKKHNQVIYQNLTSWINNFSVSSLRLLIIDTQKNDIGAKINNNSRINNSSDNNYKSSLRISCSGLSNFYTLKEVVEDTTDLNNMFFSTFSKFLTEVKLQNTTKKVFISYSHNNSQWMYKLKVHLGGFIQQKKIEIWDDTSILPGENWDKEIGQRLEQSDMFILLLTADFINSKYIMSKELAKAYQNMESRKAILLPIYVEPFYRGSIPIINGEKLSNFEMLPKNKDQKLQAISQWENENEAFELIMERLDNHLK